MTDDRTILLVEDNVKLNEINRRALEKEGLTVLTALTLAEARAHLKTHAPEVILLDVLLPDGDGVDFCAEIRGGTDAHILFLTSRIEHADRLRGLDTGGDDYITKPYLLAEMLSRVRAVLRRRDLARAKPPERTLALGALTLDTVASQAFIDGEELQITGKEFSVLLLFVQSAGKELSAEWLYETAWRQPLAGDKQSVKTIVSRLRKKLEPHGFEIAAVRGGGYTFCKLNGQN
jgi:DNA-binding response OmpR family regulator